MNDVRETAPGQNPFTSEQPEPVPAAPTGGEHHPGGTDENIAKTITVIRGAASPEERLAAVIEPVEKIG